MAPADRICMPTEVPPSGVGLGATSHPGHRDGIPGGRGCAAGNFLPSLFQAATEHTPKRAITGMPAKQAGITLPKPTRTAGANWMASCMIMGHVVAVLCGKTEFRSGNHALLMGKGREEIRQRHEKEAETSLG